MRSPHPVPLTASVKPCSHQSMSRGRRSIVAAAVASLVLLGTLPAPCHCLPLPAAAAEHACCQPPSGYRVAEQGCCPAAGMAQESQTELPAPPAAATPALTVVVQVDLSAVPAAERSLPAPAPALSPPPTVRRL